MGDDLCCGVGVQVDFGWYIGIHRMCLFGKIILRETQELSEISSRFAYEKNYNSNA